MARTGQQWFRILTQEESAARGVQIGSNQRQVQFHVPSVEIRHPALGAGAQMSPELKFVVTQQIDEQGELLSTHLADLIGSLRRGPQHADTNQITLQRILRSLQREVGINLKNREEFRPSIANLRIMDEAHNLGLTGGLRLGRVQEGYMTLNTALSVPMPAEFFSRSPRKRFLPRTGNLPAYLKSFAYIERMDNGLGTTTYRLMGNESLEALKQNDPDGDRLITQLLRLMDREDREVAKFYRTAETPSTALHGVRQDVSAWMARVSPRGFSGVERELELVQGVDFLGGQNPKRIAQRAVESWRRHTLPGTRATLEEALEKVQRQSSSIIGKVTNAVDSQQIAMALLDLSTMGEAERNRILMDPARLTMYLALNQPLKLEGGPHGARQLIESAIQAEKKGRTADLQAIARQLPMGLQRVASQLYDQKTLLQRSRGEMDELIAHLMAGGNLQESLSRVRFGLISAQDLNPGKYLKNIPDPKLIQRPWSPVEGRTITGHLRGLGILDVNTLGSDLNQTAGQVVMIRDPSTGQFISKFNRTLVNEQQGEVGTAFMVNNILAQDAQGTVHQTNFLSWLEGELEQNDRLRQALTIRDSTMGEDGERFVGELTGRWDYRRLMKGDTPAQNDVRAMSNVLGKSEAQIWGELRRGPQAAQAIITRYELIRDSWRMRTIEDQLLSTIQNVGGQEARYEMRGGLPHFAHGALDLARQGVVIDTGVIQGSIEQRTAAARHIVQNSPVQLADSFYKMYGEDRFIAGSRAFAPGTNAARAQVSLWQGINSDHHRATFAIAQIDPQAMAGALQEHAAFHGQQLSATEAQGMLRDMVSDDASTASIRGLDFVGQELSFMSADFVQRLNVDRRLMSETEAQSAPGLRKMVSSMGMLKTEGLFSSLNFEVRMPNGNRVPVDILQTIEQIAAKGQMATAARAVLNANPSAEGEAAYSAIQALSAQHTEMPDTVQQEVLGLLQKVFAGQEGELWAMGVGADRREVLVGKAGRYPLYMDEVKHVLNSTELTPSEMRAVADTAQMSLEEVAQHLAAGGQQARGFTTGSFVRDQIAEIMNNVEHIAQEIGARGGNVEGFRQQAAHSMQDYIRRLGSEPEPYNQETEPLVNALQSLGQALGYTASPQDLERVAQRATGDPLAGIESIARRAGIRQHSSQAVNSSVDVAAEVFGRSTLISEELKKVGQTILRQLLD